MGLRIRPRLCARVTVSAVLTCAATLMVLPLAAQEHARDGFSIGAGLGWGTLGCSVCDGERWSGLSGYLDLGGAVADRWFIGFAANFWAKQENQSLAHSNLGITVRFYPSPHAGLFFRGGLGVTDLDLFPAGFDADTESGFGGIVGLGYDLWLGADFYLAPYANLLLSTFEPGSSNVLQVGIGLARH